jgi:GT2 family glycosyltransferase
MFSEVNNNPTKLTNYFFAPFTLYKHVWTDIGGHDVTFRKSREDSDIALRLCLNNCKFVQCWDAMVYHFTCTSSRGIEWWSKENQDKEIVRRANDAIELNRFIKKWGTFVHPTSLADIPSEILNNPSAHEKIYVTNPDINSEQLQIL